MRAEMIYAPGREFCLTSTVSTTFVARGGYGSHLLGATHDHPNWAWYLDFSCSVGCNALGYKTTETEAIALAMKGQIDSGLCQFSFNDWYHEPGVRLCQKLTEITPGFDRKKAFLCNSGTEAIEAAIKLAKSMADQNGLRHRNRFLSFNSAFHGRTLGALSLNFSRPHHTQAFFNNLGPTSLGVEDRAFRVSPMPFPDKYNPASVEHFKAYLDLLFLKDVCAVFLELVQGEGGLNVADEECIRLLIEKCRREEVLVVVDEVQTGFMRTGQMFACGHYQLEPDIICLAKALGGGLPVGAIVAKEGLDYRPGEHSNTFGGNPVCCAAALAFIEQLEKLDKKGFGGKITRLSEFAPEGLGFMRRIGRPTTEARDTFVKACLERQLLLIGTGTTGVRIMPPLNISWEDLDEGLGIMEYCMDYLLD